MASDEVSSPTCLALMSRSAACMATVTGRRAAGIRGSGPGSIPDPLDGHDGRCLLTDRDLGCFQPILPAGHGGEGVTQLVEAVGGDGVGAAWHGGKPFLRKSSAVFGSSCRTAERRQVSVS